jgi:cobalt-zinc-cadmium efflux system membrane fusion protein
VGSQRAEVAAAQARVDAARAALEREERLVARGVSPRKNLEEARRELLAADAERDAAGAALAAAGASSGRGGRHVLKAPFAGTVTARSAVAGRIAAPDEVLVEIADLSRVWAQLDVPESEARSVRAGQRVVLTLDAVRGETLDGRITRVESSVDAATRTVRARVELPNPGHALKAGMLLRAVIEVAPPRAAVLVPARALQRAEGQDLVFVRESERTFRPVAVEVGERHGAAVAVSGVPAGADVVLEGAFLLKTEILKDSIGAGCCDPAE